jgi:vanillate O-demethylase monooxygenase subunit
MPPPFWQAALRGNGLDDQVAVDRWQIFSEDRAMLELQQQNILRHPERKLLKLNIDAGGVQSRRIIDQWLARERAGEAA